MTGLMGLRGVAAFGVAATLWSGVAQACEPASYTVKEGDTVFMIAEQFYGSVEQWSLIYYSNQSLLANPLDIAAGTVISVPCDPSGTPFVAFEPDETPLLVEEAAFQDAEMKLVTGDNYAPFTDRALPGNGMLTEIVNAAMELAPDPVSYSINWENDWSRHLFPILDDKVADMGFPWIRPDCAATPDNERCANFHFSEPLVEMLVLLFEHKDRPVAFTQDADIAGRTLCRPQGYFTHDLDRPDRQWLTNDVVSLVQASSPQACFDLLVRGEVDAVTINEFTGLTAIAEMGLQAQIQPVPRPLSIEGLHVVISKKHWRGTTFLYRFNAGLEALKASDRYDEIVSRHLGLFWETIN